MPNKKPSAKKRSAKNPRSVKLPDQPKREGGDPLAQEIGRRILKAREGLGWSQNNLHSRTKKYDPSGQGISRGVLSLYETGINKPGAREIVVLCETLRITPNWLLSGSESPAKTIQASLDFLQGDDLSVSVRLAYALLALDPEERDALGGLLLALVGKRLGDLELSNLMVWAGFVSKNISEDIDEVLGKDAHKKPLRALISEYVRAVTEGGYTNVGNLRPFLSAEQMDDFDPDKPPSSRKL